MATFDFIADIHCHPEMKPFGKSYPQGFRHDPDPRQPNNVWKRDRVDFLESLGLLFGLTKFRQSDLSSGTLGRVRLLVVSLYPLERGFVTGANGRRHGPRIDALVNLATGVGPACIDATQATRDYFPTLEQQYEFWRQLDGRPVPRGPHAGRHYRLCRTAQDVEQALNDPQATAVVFSIEGAHAFGPGAIFHEKPFDHALLLERITKVKKWPHRPLFVTLMHHFYNELGGHAPSLAGIVALSTNQRHGRGEPLNDLGREVVRRLLDPADGRILIDIKHMSRQCRDDYYRLLDQEYGPHTVPIVVSHGAVSGSALVANNPFLNEEINFDDDDLIRVARSGGLFGIQLDQRRIASAEVIRANKNQLDRGRWRWAGLVWAQLRHVAEVLDHDGLPAWNTACLGTDFDGIVNPIRRFQTHDDLPRLADFLLEHLEAYFNQRGGPPLQVAANRELPPQEILNRFLGGNALALIQQQLVA
ncbi:membrane dipeptidase [Hymenobacter sp. B81]|uniref:membrane dipeptidase n=1 Tax=Hymenobacter sp. B81 TaxID=3344878 RepID=UPI0037DCF437